MQKLSVKEKSAYGFGEIAGSFLWTTIMFYLAKFYTDVYGLPAAAAGTMFLIVKLFDAANDPIMGTIADRTNTKWGKFRPYILWLCVPYALCGILLFVTPNFNATGKIIYAYATYMAMMMIYTAMMIPFSALGGVMTSDPVDRTSLQSFRFTGAFSGNLLIQALTLPLVALLGVGSESKGWFLTMMIFALASIGLFLFMFANVRERVQPDPKVKSTIKEDMKDLFANPPWIVISLVLFVMLIYIGVRSAIIVYYFDYYVGNVKLTSWYLASGTAVIILSMLLPKWLTVTFGKRNALIGLLLITGLAIAAHYFARPQDIVLLFVLNLVQSFASGPTMPLLWSMMADAADYSEWKTGRRATALFYSASTFALKSGGALGGALALWILAAYGYQANVAQTAHTLFGMRMMLSLYPAIGVAISVVIIAFYSLSEKQLRQIEADLTKRRSDH